MTVHMVIEWLSIGIDGVGVVVILLGFSKAAFHFFANLSLQISKEKIAAIQKIRCDFGTYLVFALELMIVSDLLHSVMSRHLEDLYFLGAIVVIRTVIAYFLNKEILELSEASA